MGQRSSGQGRSLTGLQYDPDAPHGHVESYFLKANDPSGRRAIWIKATVLASSRDPRAAIAEAWAIAFDRDHGHLAVKASLPFTMARFAKGRLDAEVDGSTFTLERWKGAAVTGERSVRWDLALTALANPLHHLPSRALYAPAVPTFKMLALVPHGRATGEVHVGDRAWSLDGWPMTLGHNWGRRHTPRYAWGHVNLWESGETDLFFEGFSGRVALGPALAPTSTFLFVDDGRTRVGKRSLFGVGPASGHMSLRRWTFSSGRPGHAAVEGEIWAETDDFVGLYYQNPDGTMTYCLNTKLAHAELVVRLPGRGERLYRSRTAALEIATPDPHHGVRMYV